MGIFSLGLLSDLLQIAYMGIPFALYLWLIPDTLFRRRSHYGLLLSFFFITISFLLLSGLAEWFFWDEFSARFNFIAVDYLVYTTEVIGNINESYPTGWLLLATAGISALVTYLLRTKIKFSTTTSMSFQKRMIFLFSYGVLIVTIFFGIPSKYHHFSSNAFVNELAGNGLYELFSAYRHNELDYEQFYRGEVPEKVFAHVRQLLKTREATYTSMDDTLSIERYIKHAGAENKMNVVLISVESLSADFMEHFGNKENITPFLDSLAEKSLFFTNLYATGTRTVRGLEALSLCIPPTPGQSIVRRPNNENLFSLGSIFQRKGYKSEFLYGGYGYFDNMNYFFGHNHYTVLDRTVIPAKDIVDENIWGVADENLFDLALKELDHQTTLQPVFAHIMTTSNHRPFTYPDGRINIPSHTSRSGAVKYTDYTIGRFIRQASTHTWFKKTMFVIVADHCASSAGKTEMPIDKYHIPMLIYCPASITPGVMDRLMSQIDIGPTVLGLLNFSYTSKFFGFDMFELEAGRERAFISTYQNLGYLKAGELVILSPRFEAELYRVGSTYDSVQERKSQTITEAIAWYQAASYSFKNGLLK